MNTLKNVAALAFLSAFILAGCASSGPVVTDKGVPEPERATIYLVGQEYTLNKVDGKSVGGMFGGPKGVGLGAFKKELKPTAQIPSGEREIELNVGGFGANPKAKYDFLPGKKYRVAYETTADKGLAGALKPEITIGEITGEIPKE